MSGFIAGADVDDFGDHECADKSRRSRRSLLDASEQISVYTTVSVDSSNHDDDVVASAISTITAAVSSGALASSIQSYAAAGGITTLAAVTATSVTGVTMEPTTRPSVTPTQRVTIAPSPTPTQSLAPTQSPAPTAAASLSPTQAEDNAFLRNSAGSSGAALFWNYNDMDEPADFHLVVAEENTAAFGGAIATPAHTITASCDKTTPAISGVPFGDKDSSPVIVGAYDYYGYLSDAGGTVGLDCTTLTEIKGTTMTTVLGGTTTAELTDGVATLGASGTTSSDLYVKLKPNFTVTMDVSLSFVLPEGDSRTLSTDVDVFLRGCQAGEEVKDGATCNTCEDGEFSFFVDSCAPLDVLSCCNCPKNTQCAGTTIEVRAGHWRSTKFGSDLVRECTTYSHYCKGGNDTTLQCRGHHAGPL
jgi:hypothetical protein